MFQKHFKQWTSENLLPFCIGGDSDTATAFSRALLNKPVNDTTVSVSFCDKKINLPSFIAFITKEIDVSGLMQNKILTDNLEALPFIADGANLWTSTVPLVVKLKESIRK